MNEAKKQYFASVCAAFAYSFLSWRELHGKQWEPRDCVTSGNGEVVPCSGIGPKVRKLVLHCLGVQIRDYFRDLQEPPRLKQFINLLTYDYSKFHLSSRYDFFINHSYRELN